MTDSMGLVLKAGESVLYRDEDDDEGVRAFVLRVIDADRCLIQMEPSRFAQALDEAKKEGMSPQTIALLIDQHLALMAESMANGIDPQGAYEAPSKRLTFLPEITEAEEFGDDY
jgi:hypothetical protein